MTISREELEARLKTAKEANPTEWRIIVRRINGGVLGANWTAAAYVISTDPKFMVEVCTELLAAREEIARLTPKPKHEKVVCKHVNTTDVWENQEREYWVCDDCGASNL